MGQRRRPWYDSEEREDVAAGQVLRCDGKQKGYLIFTVDAGVCHIRSKIRDWSYLQGIQLLSLCRQSAHHVVHAPTQEPKGLTFSDHIPCKRQI